MDTSRLVFCSSYNPRTSYGRSDGKSLDESPTTIPQSYKPEVLKSVEDAFGAPWQRRHDATRDRRRAARCWRLQRSLVAESVTFTCLRYCTATCLAIVQETPVPEVLSSWLALQNPSSCSFGCLFLLSSSFASGIRYGRKKHCCPGTGKALSREAPARKHEAKLQCSDDDSRHDMARMQCSLGARTCFPESMPGFKTPDRTQPPHWIFYWCWQALCTSYSRSLSCECQRV